MLRLFSKADKLIVELLVAVVKIYQILISPEKSFWGKGRNIKICRFHPTCSDYTIGSLRQHGIIKGGFLSVRRILRCHPWNPGGYDPVPKRRSENKQ